MIICGHLIETAEIIGIGPLMHRVPIDPISTSTNRRQLHFKLHFRQHSTDIESDMVAIGWGDTDDAQVIKDREYFQKFKSAYEDAKSLVLLKIGNK